MRWRKPVMRASTSARALAAASCARPRRLLRRIGPRALGATLAQQALALLHLDGNGFQRAQPDHFVTQTQQLRLLCRGLAPRRVGVPGCVPRARQRRLGFAPAPGGALVLGRALRHALVMRRQRARRRRGTGSAAFLRAQAALRPRCVRARRARRRAPRSAVRAGAPPPAHAAPRRAARARRRAPLQPPRSDRVSSLSAVASESVDASPQPSSRPRLRSPSRSTSALSAFAPSFSARSRRA